MDPVHVVILIAVVVGVLAAVAGAATNVSYARSAAGGIAIGLLLWVVAGISIFRGPDNPDLGEVGWTVVAGIAIGIWVGAWLVGAAAGRLLRGSLRDRRE